MTTVRVARQKTHRVLPAIRFRFDVWLLLSVAALLVFGLMMVYDTTFDLGLLAQNNSLYYFQRQLIAAVLGLFGLCCYYAVRLSHFAPFFCGYHGYYSGLPDVFALLWGV